MTVRVGPAMFATAVSMIAMNCLVSRMARIAARLAVRGSACTVLST